MLSPSCENGSENVRRGIEEDARDKRRKEEGASERSSSTAKEESAPVQLYSTAAGEYQLSSAKHERFIAIRRIGGGVSLLCCLRRILNTMMLVSGTCEIVIMSKVSSSGETVFRELAV